MKIIGFVLPVKGVIRVMEGTLTVLHAFQVSSYTRGYAIKIALKKPFKIIV